MFENGFWYTQPLGISDFEWPANPQGITIGWGELRMRPQDLAKIGYLYLNEGRWDGEQIIPSAWVDASTRKYIDATLQDGYGYQWWIDPDGVYSARGYAGQYIFVVPDSELVAVFTGNLSEEEITVPEILLQIFVIPAAVSTEALPPNPEGVEWLESSIHAAALPATKPEPVAQLPEVARRVSGKTYLLEPPDPSGLTSISLIFNELDIG